VVVLPLGLTDAVAVADSGLTSRACWLLIVGGSGLAAVVKVASWPSSVSVTILYAYSVSGVSRETDALTSPAADTV
jgi:hypothetical protein